MTDFRVEIEVRDVAVGLQRFVITTGPGEGRGEGVLLVRSERVQLQRASHFPNGRVELATEAERIAVPLVSQGVVRIERNSARAASRSPAAQDHSCVRTPASETCASESVSSSCIARSAAALALSQATLGGKKLNWPNVIVRIGQPGPRRCVARVSLDGALKVFDAISGHLAHSTHSTRRDPADTGRTRRGRPGACRMLAALLCGEDESLIWTSFVIARAMASCKPSTSRRSRS